LLAAAAASLGPLNALKGDDPRVVSLLLQAAFLFDDDDCRTVEW